MVSNTRPIDHADDTHAPSPSKLLSLLEQQHRRVALRYLLDRECPVPLDELATHLVEHQATSADDRKRLCVELHHNHLPRLADYGCIRYDIETNTVEQVFDVHALKTIFELATDSDG